MSVGGNKGGLIMREILFRGKRKDNGEWVEGFLLKGQRTYIVTLDAVDYMVVSISYAACVELVEVIPESVSQYTGLTDKNGEKIFEGDLLNGFEYPFLSDNEHNYFAEVIWFDNCPAFGLYTHKHPLATVSGISAGNCDIIEDFDGSQWEVIGNIHDNTEMLEG